MAYLILLLKSYNCHSNTTKAPGPRTNMLFMQLYTSPLLSMALGYQYNPGKPQRNLVFSGKSRLSI